MKFLAPAEQLCIRTTPLIKLCYSTTICELTWLFNNTTNIFFLIFKDYNRQISQYHTNIWYYQLKCDKHIWSEVVFLPDGQTFAMFGIHWPVKQWMAGKSAVCLLFLFTFFWSTIFVYIFSEQSFSASYWSMWYHK